MQKVRCSRNCETLGLFGFVTGSGTRGRQALPFAKRSAAEMASSAPIVSEASLTTLYHILSCFLEPCPPGTSAVGAAKVYWHQIVDTLAFIMGEPALDYLKPNRAARRMGALRIGT